MKNKYFNDKDDGYYNVEKSRFVPFIPEGANFILDLGCGAGRLGRRLRELNRASQLIGVEIFPLVAKKALKYYDKIYQGDIEEIELPYEKYFDYVICGDILEHLRDPWVVLAEIKRWLKDSGQLICSIPNIRYWQILRDLMLFGKWNYTEAGILDYTHLRFFTRKSFLNILQRGGFDIVHQEMIVHGKKKDFANAVTFFLFEEFLGAQILVCAKKSEKS